MSFTEIIDMAFACAKTVTNSKIDADSFLLVVTGGEPTIQPNLTEFLRMAHESITNIQIETNGIHCRYIPIATTVIVSPKVNERTNTYIEPHTGMLTQADALKFVVSKTMPGYTDIPEFAFGWKRDQKTTDADIYISPMAIYTRKPAKFMEDHTLAGRVENERISFWEPGLLDYKACQANYEHAAALAMEYNATLSIQMHLFANLP
jgi:7-carboxy-7-deazaguanine synthase